MTVSDVSERGAFARPARALRVGGHPSSFRSQPTQLSVGRRSRWLCARVVGATSVTAVMLGGCASSGTVTSDSSSSPSSSSSTARSSSAKLHLSSTIGDGAHLSRVVTWRAEVEPARDVTTVDFIVDGRRLWEEQKPPYVFNDDHQLLAPWLLGNGKHTLEVRAAAGGGETARSVAHVTVTKLPTIHVGLVGVFSRTVTPKDFARESAMRGYDPDALPPSGRWKMHINSQGLISFDDPEGTGQKEILTTTDSTMTVFGPASWLAPEDRHGGFCEPAPIDRTYRWELSGTTLTIRGGSNCPQRVGVLDGEWTMN